MAKKKVKDFVLVEKESFEADEHDEPEEKNQRLAELLNGPWLGFAIVRIDRIEIGTMSGWRVLHRK